MEKKYIPDPNIPILVKIEPETDATGGPGKVGEKFVHYWKKKLGENCTADDIASKIPDVDIKFKVKRLSDFDSKAGTFYVDCLLMLDWEDESLADADESPDFMEHFWPKVEILNQTPGQTKPEYETIKPKYKKSKDIEKDKKAGKFFGVHRAALTIQVQMVLFARVDFRQFPFDHQTLELTLKLSSIRVPGVKSGTRPTARHPQRWRGASDNKEGGHTLVKDCDCLPEYDIVRLCSRAYSSAYGPFVAEGDKKKYEKDLKANKLYQDEYTLQIIMVRDSVSVMWNMCFSLFVIDVMVFAAHGIPMADLADRLSVNLTLLLTAMAFKWVLSDSLPPVPYLTTMEIYVIATFACLWLQGLAFWFLADMYNYRCENDGEEGATDYWTGESLPNNTAIPMDATCALLQQIDRSVLMVEVMALVLKNVWFLYRVAINRKAKVMKETHYQDLGSLAEFSMTKDMKFIGDGEMEGILPLEHVGKHTEGAEALYGGVGGGGDNISSRNLAQVAPEPEGK